MWNGRVVGLVTGTEVWMENQAWLISTEEQMADMGARSLQ